MSHPLNEEYLIKIGWKRVEGGWLPEEVDEDVGLTPSTTEEALFISRIVEKEMSTPDEEE